MPRPTPAYRQRNGYDQALVTLRDAVTKKARDYWLGPYNTPQSRELYHRLVADWEANGRRLPSPRHAAPGAAPAEMTVVELARLHIEGLVGQMPDQDYDNLKSALRVLIQLCGTVPATDFGPNKLRLVREAMIHGDSSSPKPRKPWSRRYVNSQTQRIVRMFKWASARELLPVTVFQQLKTVDPLRRGRCAARETDPIRPVADELVDAIRPFVSRQIWALVELQRLTGARPGELFGLTPRDIQMDPPSGSGTSAAAIWTFSPDRHKTAYHGKRRTIYFGPRAQEVLRPFLAGREEDVPLFSPAEADAERRARLHRVRSTPLSCGNRPGTNRKPQPKKAPGPTYDRASYAKAIMHACDKAFPLPSELRKLNVRAPGRMRRETAAEWRSRLGEKRWQQAIAWQKAHRWHPYQLRHSAATNIRRQFGLEAAQIALGHSSALVTEAVYAERDITKAIAVMQNFG